MKNLFGKKVTDNTRPMGSMDPKPKKSVRKAMRNISRAATREIISSGAAMATNIVVTRATNDTLVAATNAVYNVHGMIRPHTVDVKLHRLGKTKTVTQQEAATLLAKGKKLKMVKSNAWLDQPRNNELVQGVITGASLITGGVTALKIKSEVKTRLRDQQETWDSCFEIFEDEDFTDTEGGDGGEF